MKRKSFLTMLSALIVGFLTDLRKVKIFQVPLHVCEIKVQLPVGHQKDNFLSDKKKWMQPNLFEGAVAYFEKKNKLDRIERTLGKSAIIYKFFFNSKMDHDLFVDIINEKNIVSETDLNSMGYQFSRLYYKA